MSPKRDENGTVSRNANSTWTPVWTTRTSCRSSIRLRSRRSKSVSSGRPGAPPVTRPTPAGGSDPDPTEGDAPPLIRSAALHPRAGDDVVAPVGPADPRLVAAVVVVAEQHERRLLAQRRARLVALGVDA